MYLQSSRQRLVLFLYYTTFLFSILFPTSHVGIHLIGSKSQEQERYSLSLLLFYNAASAAASLSSALCGTFAFAPSLKAL